ncbi:MAG: ribonuclease HII [Coriobacteriales bacterium]|jgi:ribonuclease HII|nr:ribonuclease HII [Coriobacteriales bacterium]
MIRAASSDELEQLVLRYGNDPRKGIQTALRTAQRQVNRAQSENQRLTGLYRLLESTPDSIVVGIDEVGRGALAGPLLVAAVILPAHPYIYGLDDSKRLTPDQRRKLASRIFEVATAVGLGRVEAADIDQFGMAMALRQAIGLALQTLDVEPDVVLLDGRPLNIHPQEVAIVGGDATEASIAAASVIAKVTRDEWMIKVDKVYPGYGLAANKGYGTPTHVAALKKLGLSEIHRKSFCSSILHEQESLF